MGSRKVHLDAEVIPPVFHRDSRQLKDCHGSRGAEATQISLNVCSSLRSTFSIYFAMEGKNLVILFSVWIS